MKEKIFCFIVGAVVGSAVTYFFVRDNMEQRIEAEVEEVRNTYKAAKMQQNASESVSEDSGVRVNTLTINEYGKPEKNLSEEDILHLEEMQASVEEAKQIAAENAKKKADFFANQNIINANGYSAEPISYNLFSKPPAAKDIHNGVDEGEDLRVMDPAARPYVISPEEFVSEHKEYDKTTLMYFTDGILLEEMSREIIPDIESAIGSESLNHFGEYEDDVVYVRNERISTDFEVIFNDAAFVNLYNDNG